MVVAETCRDYFLSVGEVVNRFPLADAVRLQTLVRHTYETGHALFVAGNGGCATVADHFALGMSLNILRESGVGSRAFSLSSGPMLSAAVNDFGYEQMFAVQLRALAKSNDMFIALSSSGKSMNLANAVSEARTLGLTTAAVVGRKGAVSVCASHIVSLDVDSPAVAEDVMIMMLHWLYCSFMVKVDKLEITTQYDMDVRTIGGKL